MGNEARNANGAKHMAKYPRSAYVTHGFCGLPYEAGAINMGGGRSRRPNNITATIRAGNAVDLETVRRARLGGSKEAARARLEFMRAARVFLLAG
jgi:hypothetical protein